jgi:endo-1,4-beta-xylanase
MACSDGNGSTTGSESGGSASGGTRVSSGTSTGIGGNSAFTTFGVATGGQTTGVSTSGVAAGGKTTGVSTGGVAAGGQTTGVSAGGVAAGGKTTGVSAGGVAAGGKTTGVSAGGVAAGGVSTGGTESKCSEANSEVCASNNSNKVGKHCGLTYEIWTDSSNSCMTNTADGFTASWTQQNGNYLARKGVRPGSADPVVTFNVDYQPNGNSYLAIYGWTQNPLIEYYIVESYGTWRPPGNNADLKGSVDVDGGTYEIYQTTRVDKPSIEGNKTFDQFWSVRKEKRTSGTITVGPHFEAWKKFGLKMGTFYEVSLVIEGYQSSGKANVKVSFK